MRPRLENQKVAVVGLGRSGTAAIQLLAREGARITAVDERPDAMLPGELGRSGTSGVKLVVGPGAFGALDAQDLLVVSPGVPLARPEIAAARRRGTPVWGEIELAYRFLDRPRILAITGTNGKSTTTALLGEMVASSGKEVFVGGNLGRPLSEAVGRPFVAYVVELSSFQLEAIESFRAEGAALLNLAPDHLDRYATLEEYGAAKARIFLNQGPDDVAVLNAEDPASLALTPHRPKLLGFAGGGRVPVEPGFAGLALTHVSPSAGEFEVSGVAFPSVERYRVANQALRGRHNLENAMAATLLARGFGVPPDAAQHGLDTFPGLPHRLEWSGTVNGVDWFNDSKATNVDSACVALRAFERGVWLIAGGRGKGASYEPMVREARGKLRGVLTIGEDGPAIEAAFASEVAVHRCETLNGAMQVAHRLARPGDVVLLSPACASYDQFKNFEERGETFKRLVKELAR